jgi:hypothetical protein
MVCPQVTFKSKDLIKKISVLAIFSSKKTQSYDITYHNWSKLAATRYLCNHKITCLFPIAGEKDKYISPSASKGE